uniref:peptidyl-tRNA hydrolase n=1 Tax=Trypanosoma congolense (strain IL3000) TaxID=1068625 RepID=G0UNW5_TRYCI|nr:unnamed protein product [Trypanosoma congolense IL3000]
MLGIIGVDSGTLLLCTVGLVIGLLVPLAVLGVLGQRCQAANQRLATSRRRKAVEFREKLRKRKGEPSSAPFHNNGEIPEANGAEISSESDSGEEEDVVDSSDETEFERIEELRLKMILVIRSDGKKIPAQTVATRAADAAMSLVEAVQSSAAAEDWKRWYLWWNMAGCTKITLKSSSVEELQRLLAEAHGRGLPCCSGYSDSGVVSFPTAGPGSDESELTVVAVGPVPSDIVNPLTGSLKLFS